MYIDCGFVRGIGEVVREAGDQARRSRKHQHRRRPPRCLANLDVLSGWSFLREKPASVGGLTCPSRGSSGRAENPCLRNGHR